MKLASFTGLPAIDAGQRIEIGVERCQLHAGSLGVSQGQGVDKAKPRNICPNFESAQNRALVWMTEPAE